ncbi:MAG: molecular chaperone Tir [Desulfobacteraceae bacterium 4572_19]|nr:MAG: molecular chaperone Tir [Desulfobacteraceae bacterium 4572_19]
MQEKFNLVKQYIHDMELAIISEDTADEIVVVEDEENGIKNLVIDCEEPIVVLEQVILKVPQKTQALYKRLLQMNRTLVHGAFVLDEDEKYIIFRDTLQLENLDRNVRLPKIHISCS